jgi:hypothetical protein
MLQTPVTFRGTEAPDALLVDTSEAQSLFGRPQVGLDQLMRWTADWVRRDAPTLGKPTHFDVRDGKF